MRQMGHLMRKHENNVVRRVIGIYVERSRPRGRPKKTLINVVGGIGGLERLRGLVREDANGRENGEGFHGV